MPPHDVQKDVWLPEHFCCLRTGAAACCRMACGLRTDADLCLHKACARHHRPGCRSCFYCHKSLKVCGLRNCRCGRHSRPGGGRRSCCCSCLRKICALHIDYLPDGGRHIRCCCDLRSRLVCGLRSHLNGGHHIRLSCGHHIRCCCDLHSRLVCGLRSHLDGDLHNCCALLIFLYFLLNSRDSHRFRSCGWMHDNPLLRSWNALQMFFLV